MPRREGFTLMELLIVLVIISILVTMGVNRFWKVKDQGLVSSVAHDLRNVATAQEEYFSQNYTYAAAPTDLVHLQQSPGVVVQITHVQQDGWAATASHVSLSSRTCGIFTGNAPAAAGAPATVNGIINCN
jgi:prepilin-type N-terminal cleavage/methylation domain-containing protein